MSFDIGIKITALSTKILHCTKTKQGKMQRTGTFILVAWISNFGSANINSFYEFTLQDNFNFFDSPTRQENVLICYPLTRLFINFENRIKQYSFLNSFIHLDRGWYIIIMAKIYSLFVTILIAGHMHDKVTWSTRLGSKIKSIYY